MRRARPAKVSGSVRRPLDTYVYWPERHWQTGEPGFMVVSPSGGRLFWHASEASAVAEVKRLRREAP